MHASRTECGLRPVLSGGRVRNTYETYPPVGNNPSKGGLMPHTVGGSEAPEESLRAPEEGRAAD
jgi:hypothetical protein